MSGPSIRRVQQTKLGFTIVELLIVIVVIAILAAVTIVAFSGIRQRASEASVKSELTQIAKQLGVLNVSDSQYPADIDSLKKSSTLTFQYTYSNTTNDYCLTGSSYWAEFHLSSTDTSPQTGTCSGHVSYLGVVPVHEWTVIASSPYHSCGIFDGKAYCWGENVSGQLGDGTTNDSTTPIAVSDTIMTGEVTAITASISHSCAIADNKAYCWGANGYGRLGDNTNVNSLTPVAVNTALMSGTVTSIASGNMHSCAVASGTAYCWGRSNTGQLGNGTTTQSFTPAAVTTAIMSGVASDIMTGSSFSCALSLGNIYCWGGTSGYGNLGNGTTGTSSTPVAVSTALMAAGTVTAIGAGSDANHSCAISQNKSYCWGQNLNGKLGDGTTTTRSSPVAVTTTLMSGDIQKISTGDSHTCAIDTTAQAYCWGANTNGKLGDGTTTASLTPKAVNLSGVAGSPLSISAGTLHTCAVSAEHAYCWGQNTYGQLGNGTTTASSTAVEVSATP